MTIFLDNVIFLECNLRSGVRITRSWSVSKPARCIDSLKETEDFRFFETNDLGWGISVKCINSHALKSPRFTKYRLFSLKRINFERMNGNSVSGI